MKKILLFGIVFLALALAAGPALGAADNRREHDYVGQFNFVVELAALEAGDNVGYLLRGAGKEDIRAAGANKEGEAGWLDKAVAKKVVRFKAGSDLSTTVKSAACESGGWMKIMKKILSADSPAEEIELAIEGLKQSGKITEAQESEIRERLEIAIERIERA